MAAGTRTAPTIDGTPNRIRLSVSYVSKTEDAPRSESYLISASATPAEIEAFVNGLQGMTSASIYSVAVTQLYASNPSKANATGDGKPSLEDKILMSTKNVPASNTRRVYIPSPDSGQFLPDSEVVNTDTTVGNNEALGAMIAAWNAISANYDPVTITFVEHQDTNEKQLL